MNSIDAVLERVEALPSSPQILPKLLTVLNEPDSDISRVVELIAYDPGLTARVLKLCNSAAYGVTVPVTDIAEAVNRVGLKSIYLMVAFVSGRLALQPLRPVSGLKPEVLWKHSVTAALAGQLIAQDQGDDVSSVFTVALLHDVGKIIMADAFQESYERMLAKCAAEQSSLLDEERAEFNIDHAEVGGRLLVRWKFPGTLATAVRFQHCPKAAGEGSRLAAYVHLADAVATLLESPACESKGCAPASTDALEILGLPADSLAGYRERTLENFEFVNALCRL